MKKMFAVALWAVYLFIKYVDDTNFYVEALAQGMRWEHGQLLWTEEKEEEDKREGLSDSRRTLNVLLDVANSVYTFVKFTGDLPEDHDDGKCPMLDLSVWKESIGDQEIVKHAYYEKPCASQMVIMWDSAVPDRMKITTLSQEGVRRMRNCGLTSSSSDRAKVMSDLMMKMRRSGYNGKMRGMVLECALVGYYRMRRNEEAGVRRVNRPMKEGLAEREIQKIVGKTEWVRNTNKSKTATKPVGGGRKGWKSYKDRISKKEENDKVNRHNDDDPKGRQNMKETRIEGVVFVPFTPRGTLVRELQAREDLFSKLHGLSKVKFVERGDKLTDQLVRMDPWAGFGCGKANC